MVTITALKLPVIGQFVEHIREGNGPEIVKDSLRVVVAAVAVVAFGVFPGLTARIASIPYIGQALTGFQSLSPLTQKVIIGLTSLPGLALGCGVAYIASAVAMLAKAHMALSTVACLDILSKLFVGTLLIHQYRRIEVGADQLIADELKRTKIGTTRVSVPEVAMQDVTMRVPAPTGRNVDLDLPVPVHQNSANTREGEEAAELAR